MIKKVLGKGLTSLIPDSYVNKNIEQSQQKPEPFRTDRKETLIETKFEGFDLIPLSQIAPNPDQPRQEFSPEGIEELADSIRQKGVLQPVVVRKRLVGQTPGPAYELVCGERRLKAALLCGLEKIPAIIKDVAQGDLLEWALIENIQREDLNPLEEARAFEKLIVERGLSQEEVAKRVGKDRTTIANTVRLLKLPEEVLSYVRNGELSSGHARALLGLFSRDQQIQLARRITKEKLSVRQVEDIVSRNAKKRRARPARHLIPEVADLEIKLSRYFGTQVRIYTSKNSKKGRIVIQYSSLDELDRILAGLGISPT